MKQWPYLENLAAAGVTPEVVDFVFCTHLHVDHVGWNTRLRDGRWVPTFPNARYLFGRREWEYWEERFQDPEAEEHLHYQDSILPVISAEQADFVDDGFELDEVMRARAESRPHARPLLCTPVFGRNGNRNERGPDAPRHPMRRTGLEQLLLR